MSATVRKGSVDRGDPNLRNYAYKVYRDKLASYNDAANHVVKNANVNQDTVLEDRGINAHIHKMAKSLQQQQQKR